MEAAVRLFTPAPSAAEAASFGLTVEEASGPPVEVWPDNWPAVEIFQDLMTQWRYAGMGGVRTGLDYAVIPSVFAIRGTPKKQWSGLFDDISVMEVAVLNMPQKK